MSGFFKPTMLILAGIFEVKGVLQASSITIEFSDSLMVYVKDLKRPNNP